MAAAAAATTTATENVTEDIAEDVAEIGGAGAGLTLDTGMAILVIACPFLGIGQHFKSFVGFLEFLFCLRLVGIAIGVVFHRHAPVSLLDLGFRGAALDTQYFVKIPLRHVLKKFQKIEAGSE